MYRVRRGGFRRNNARQRKNAGSRPAQPDIAGPPKKKSKMSKGKKATLAVLAVVLVLAIGAAALLANWYFSPEEKLLRALDEEDYDAALEIYGEELEGEKSEALTDKMTERAREGSRGFYKRRSRLQQREDGACCDSEAVYSRHNDPSVGGGGLCGFPERFAYRV